MTKRAARLIAAAAALWCLAGTARAQDARPAPDSPPAKPDLDQPVPAEQLAAARLLAGRAIDAIPARLARRFELTDAQAESARQIVRQGWDQLGPDNQDKLIATLIRGRQLYACGEATAEDWQRIARDAQPLIESVGKVLCDAADQLSDQFTGEQKLMFEQTQERLRAERELMAVRARLVAEGAVKLDATGQPADGWPPEAADRPRLAVRIVSEEVSEVGPDGVERKVRVRRLRSSLPDERALAADERLWPAYVRGFIFKFGLSGEQVAQARRALGESLARAREIRAGLKGPAEQARNALAAAKAAGDPGAIAAAQLALEQVDRPIAAIFADLKRQLDELPTAQQRASAKSRGDLFAAPARNQPE